MSSVNFSQLYSFYTGLQKEVMTIDQQNQQIIDYLNQHVHSHEIAQPAAFTEKYIHKVSLNLKGEAKKVKADYLVNAIDLWKAAWLEKMKKPSFEHKFEVPSTTFTAKSQNSPNGSSKATLHNQFPLDGIFSTSSSKKSTEHKTENFNDQVDTQATQRMIDLITKKQPQDYFFETVNKDKCLQRKLLQWRGKDGESVFHLACAHSRPGVLRYLQGLGIGASALDRNRKNGMHYAAIYRNNDVIDYLFDVGQGDQINVADTKGYTPMHLAILDNASRTFIRLFLRSVQNLTFKPLPTDDNILHLAAFSGLTSVFSLGLLNSGCRSALTQKNKDGHTPLLMAVENGYLGIVRLIYGFGNVQKNELEAAVTLADKAGQKKIFEFLTTNKVANAPTYDDLKRNPEKMQELITNGLDINNLQDGKSMLHRAIEDNRLDLVQLMVEKGGASLTVKAISPHRVAGQDQGLPAFYFAASLGRTKILEYLNTFYGSNEDMKRLCGFHANPIQFAKQFNQEAAAREALLNRGWMS